MERGKVCDGRCIAEGKTKFATGKTKYLQHIKIEKLDTKVKESEHPKTEDEMQRYMEALMMRVKGCKESDPEEIDCKELESVIERVCSE